MQKTMIHLEKSMAEKQRRFEMKAADILMEEHRVIERMLNSLEMAVERLDRGEAVPPRFFLEVTEFIQGFADGCHHKKEEDVLIKAMIASGMPRDEGPIAYVLAEHVQGRTLNQQMRKAAQEMQQGSESSRHDLIQSARAYVSLLRNHIVKEDSRFFPTAEQVIPPAEQERVTEDFERIEREEIGEQEHEKYLALADRLEEQVKTGFVAVHFSPS
jgi:hemerythrin-like domain-containing protein